MCVCVFLALHNGWVSPISVIVIAILLSSNVGYEAALAGISVLIGTVILQIQFGRFFYVRRAITAKLTDNRVRLLTEVLSGMLSGSLLSTKLCCMVSFVVVNSVIFYYTGMFISFLLFKLQFNIHTKILCSTQQLK